MQNAAIALLALCALTAGCANEIRQKQVALATSLTSDHFRDTATVKDDSLDTLATISTERGFVEKQGLLGVAWDDNFLRAFVDKKTGATSIQVYQVIYYRGSNWNFYQTANYETPNGPASTPVTVIKRDVQCSGGPYGDCTYVEHVGFAVDEGLLRAGAKRYTPGDMTAWRFKFGARSGKDYPDGILGAEIVGFLEALDRYRSRSGLSAAAAPAQPTPARNTSANPGSMQTSGGTTAGAASGNPQDSVAASKLAREMKCAAQENAKLTAKGPGFESFTVPCDNGDSMSIRCEWGNCRVLR